MDSCKTRGIIDAFVQENGIIRNKHGYIIGRLCEGVTIACVNEIGVKSEPTKINSDGKKYLKVFLKPEIKDDLYSGRSPEKFRDYLMDQHHLTVDDVEICEDKPKQIAREAVVRFKYVRDCPHWLDTCECLLRDRDDNVCGFDETSLPPYNCPLDEVEV